MSQLERTPGLLTKAYEDARFVKIFESEPENYSILKALGAVQAAYGDTRWAGLNLMLLVTTGKQVPASVLETAAERANVSSAFDAFRREDLVRPPYRSSLAFLIGGGYVTIDDEGSIWLTDLGLDLICYTIFL